MLAFQGRVLPRAVLDEPDIWLDENPASLIAELAFLLEEWPSSDNPTLDRIAMHRVPINDVCVTILEFAGPISRSEAYFVALIPLQTEHNPDPFAPRLRYITLERSAQGRIDAAGGTRLAEWSRLGHDDLGPGPSPVVGAFVRAIRDFCPFDTQFGPRT